MKFKTPTAKLKTMLGKVGKGLGSKMFPVTEHLLIELLEGTLYLTATNKIDWITVQEEGVEGEEGRAIVKADKLISLVSKTTKDEMTFTLKDTYLEVKGNGSYKIPLLEGTEEFPEWEFEKEEGEPVVVYVEPLKQMFTTNKSAIGPSGGYYVANKAITVDGVRMCVNESVKFWEDGTATLLSPHLTDLLMTLSGEIVKVERDGNKLLFTTPTIQIFGTEMDGVDVFPVADINALLEFEYTNSVALKRADLLDILKRLVLFADKDNNYATVLKFTDEGIEMSDHKGDSTESVPYTSSNIQEAGAQILLNAQFLEGIVSSLNDQQITLWFDKQGSPLKITDQLVTMILGIMVM